MKRKYSLHVKWLPFAVLLVFIFAMSAQVFAASSSSYKVTIQTVNSGSSTTLSSASFGLMQNLSYGQAIGMSSGSYSSSSGFIASIIGGGATFFAPIITGVTPAEGKNIAPITVTIAGANFVTGITAKLTSTTEADITGFGITAVTGGITCTFDLSGAKEGLRNVVIVNPDGTTTLLPLAFKVTSYGLVMGMAANSPNPFNPGKESTTIMYTLDADKNVNIYIFSTTAELVWKRNFLAGSNGARKGDNSVVWDGMKDFGEMASNGLFFVHVLDVSNGKIIAKGRIAVYR